MPENLVWQQYPFHEANRIAIDLHQEFPELEDEDIRQAQVFSSPRL
jgi:hypothetical protein